MKRRNLLLIMLVLICFPAFCEKHIYYVSVKGNDNAAGTLKSPFKTVQRAVEIAQRHGTDTVEIQFRGGEYRLLNSVKIMGENLILRPYRSEKVSFTGGNFSRKEPDKSNSG